MFDKFKEFIGIDDEYDDYDDDYEQEELDDEKKSSTYTSSSTYDYNLDDNSSSDNSSDSVYSSFSSSYSNNNKERKTRGGSNIVSMNDANTNSFGQSSSNKFRIAIQEPLSYDEDGPKIVDDILDKKVVVLNLEMLEVDKKRQILDFVSGAVYALDGKVEKVSKGIFVICPKGIDIDNYVEDQISSGNYNQL